MATELWRWQGGSEASGAYDYATAAAMAEDNSVVLAGYTEGGWNGMNAGLEDFAAIKLNVYGTELWRWQEGSDAADRMNAIVMGDDGCVVLAGYTYGVWNDDDGDGSTTGASEATSDFVAVKLDTDGTVVWRWQASSTADGGADDFLYAAAMGDDGSVVLAGVTWGEWARSADTNGGDMAAVKLDADGAVLWRWQNGTSLPDGTNLQDEIQSVVMLQDGSVVLAGHTAGDYDGGNDSGGDFLAIKLDADGTELWSWQEGTLYPEYLTAATLGGDDGSVILAGNTFGTWTGTSVYSSGTMFAAVKLDSDGAVLWRWQDGTGEEDIVKGAALAPDGSVILAGYTMGIWEGTRNAGSTGSSTSSSSRTADFAAVRLAGDDGTELWRWQDGTFAEDMMNAVATGSDGLVILAGQTESSLDGANVADDSTATAVNEYWDFAAIMFNLTDASSLAASSSTPGDSNFSPAPSAGSSSTSETPSQVSTTPAPVSSAGRNSSYNPLPTPAPTTGDSSSRATFFRTPGPTPEVSVTPVGSSSAASRGEPSSSISSPSTPKSFTIIVVSVAAAAAVILVTAVCLRRRWAARREKKKCIAPVHPDGPSGLEFVGLEGIVDTDGNGNSHNSSSGSPTVVAGSLSPSGDYNNDHNNRHTRDPPPYVQPPLVSERASRLLEPRSPAVSPPVPLSVIEASRAKAETSLCDGSVGPTSGGTKGNGCGERSGGGGSVSMARAVLEAAETLAQNCSSVPGVAEAATLVTVLVNLATDHRSNAGAAATRLRRCRSILTMLERAAKVLGKGGEAVGEAEKLLIEDVHASVNDLVQLMQAWKSKNMISKVFTSSLCKRRQEEAEAAISDAVTRLQLGLQVQVAQGVQDAKEELQLQRRASQGLAAESVANSLAKARRDRRKRRLDQIEIPPDHLTLTNELLGSGGFAKVYLADYNGRNAAAKVLQVDHDNMGDIPYSDDMFEKERVELVAEQDNFQRQAFVRELEVMIRLRSPHTVHVYGAITSRKEEFILVMELLPGGDLRSLLRQAKKSLSKARARGIIGDVAAGMAFLHRKLTVHGDLKSANVLLDGAGHAKIGDFGTSRWAQHTMSTGLATYTVSQQGRMSIPWAAPEVLTKGATSYSSDVYSFGMVVWEVLSRDVPWAGEPDILGIHRRVVFCADRPVMPADAHPKLADLAKACWAVEPEKRPSFRQITGDLAASG